MTDPTAEGGRPLSAHERIEFGLREIRWNLDEGDGSNEGDDDAE